MEREVTVWENDEQVTKRVTEIETRWTWVSGQVRDDFDDILVSASKSLPEELLESLEPWDLRALEPFDERYLAGFRTETYQVSIREGYGQAKLRMDSSIRDSISRDIGGDHQRIHSVDTHYFNATFKHILMPLWISSYRYKEKVYRFLVNARTGEVQGERPLSGVKIFLFVLSLAVLGAAAYFGYEYWG